MTGRVSVLLLVSGFILLAQFEALRSCAEILVPAAHAGQSEPKQGRKPDRLPRRDRQTDVIVYPPAPTLAIPPSLTPTEPGAAPLPAPERIEADISTRTIAVTSAYAGAEILVFGTIENSRQPSAESGYYDVVVVVEGQPERVMVRRKSRIGGLWINTQSFVFSAAPSYYATASTRPIDDFTDKVLRDEIRIGFDAIGLVGSAERGRQKPMTAEEVMAYRSAVVRLKQDARLYQSSDYGVIFTGRSLFRAKIDLPANVPVGPLTTRVYLFQDGSLLSSYQSRVVLEREGIERWLYMFAFDHSYLYGLFTVLLAVLAGLAASAIFQRRTV
ncbi:MAG: TIGR02186 family protein [Hyphomicrobium sp.]|nr:TIGR02186 family protein [Hyphomicrobium sp.]